jgi:hypothetical protein
MALIEKKTEEEKAAAKQAKREAKEAARRQREQQKADRVAEAERKKAELEAAKAAAQAKLDAHAEALPKWEYKVLTNTALAGWGGGTIQGLEPMLNNYADKGWRVISMSFTGQIDQFLAADKNHLYIVLERPAIYDDHIGHAVNRKSD